MAAVTVLSRLQSPLVLAGRTLQPNVLNTQEMTLNELFNEPELLDAAARGYLSMQVTYTAAEQVLMSQAALPALRGLLFVDAAANPNVATGSIAQPFATLQAALAVVQSNTTIRMAGGTYSGNVVMPDVEGVQIQGAGKGQTFLTASSGSTFSWVRSASAVSVQRFQMSDLTVVNTSTTASDAGILVDADAETASTFGVGTIAFVNVDVQRSGVAGGVAAYLRRVVSVYAQTCSWMGLSGALGATVLKNVGRMTISTSSILTSMDVEFIRANNQPFGGRNAISLVNGSAVLPSDFTTPAGQGGVVLRGHPFFSIDASCTLSGCAAAPALQGVGLTAVSTGPASAPIIQIKGSIGVGASVTGSGSVQLALPQFTSGAPPSVVDFSGASFFLINAAAGAFTITCGSSSTTAQSVSMMGARLLFLDAIGVGSVTGAVQIGSVTAGVNNPISLDVRGSIYPSQAIFSAAASVGSLDRTTWSHASTAVSTSPTVCTLTIPYPTGATYHVTSMPATAISVGFSAVGVGAFTATASGAGNASFVLTRIG